MFHNCKRASCCPVSGCRFIKEKQQRSIGKIFTLEAHALDSLYVVVYLRHGSIYCNRPICENDVRKKVQVGSDQEKAQSEKDSHSKNGGGKKLN